MKQQIFVFLLSLSFTSLAFSDWKKIDAGQFTLARPPALGSAPEQREVAELLDLQDKRSDEACQIARNQLIPTFSAFWANSKILTNAELRRSSSIMGQVSNLVEGVTSKWKKTFNRPRPYASYPDIQPCIMKPFGRSYPSAHASMSSAQACLLAKKFPDRAEAILANGDYAGNLRSIAGVHYPSDVEAGKKLGEDICHTLLKDPSFVKDFTAF